MPPYDRKPRTIGQFCTMHSVTLVELVQLESKPNFWRETVNRTDYWLLRLNSIYQAILDNALNPKHPAQQKWMLFYCEAVLTGKLAKMPDEALPAKVEKQTPNAEDLGLDE